MNVQEIVKTLITSGIVALITMWGTTQVIITRLDTYEKQAAEMRADIKQLVATQAAMESAQARQGTQIEQLQGRH